MVFGYSGPDGQRQHTHPHSWVMGPYTLCTSNHAVPPSLCFWWPCKHVRVTHPQETHPVSGGGAHTFGGPPAWLCAALQQSALPAGKGTCFRSSQLSDLLFLVNRSAGEAKQAGSRSGDWRGKALLLWLDIGISPPLISVHTFAHLPEGPTLFHLLICRSYLCNLHDNSSSVLDNEEKLLSICHSSVQCVRGG